MGSVTYLLEVYGMERHVYKFEFKYDRQVNGKKTEFTVPVIVHNECYADACTKVNEFVRKNLLIGLRKNRLSSMLVNLFMVC